MRKFTFLQAVPHSFYSADLYRDVARNWKGAAFGYLILVQSVVLLSTAYQIHREWASYMDDQGVAIVQQMPTVVIDEGVARVEAEQPYMILDPDTGAAMVILDTTGEITEITEDGVGALLTRDRLFVRKDDHKTQIYELSQIDHFELDSERLEGWRELARDWFVVLMFPFLVFGLAIFRAVQVLFFGVLGNVFAKRVGVRLDFPSLLSLAAVSLTPAICAEAVLDLPGARPPAQGLILFGVSLFYFARAVMANVETQQPLGTPPPIE